MGKETDLGKRALTGIAVRVGPYPLGRVDAAAHLADGTRTVERLTVGASPAAAPATAAAAAADASSAGAGGVGGGGAHPARLSASAGGSFSLTTGAVRGHGVFAHLTAADVAAYTPARARLGGRLSGSVALSGSVGDPRAAAAGAWARGPVHRTRVRGAALSCRRPRGRRRLWRCRRGWWRRTRWQRGGRGRGGHRRRLPCAQTPRERARVRRRHLPAPTAGRQPSRPRPPPLPPPTATTASASTLRCASTASSSSRRSRPTWTSSTGRPTWSSASAARPRRRT